MPPPNEDLADLAAVLGSDNVRTLVRTFLREFPVSLVQLGAGDRAQRLRIAHSLKSNSRLVGAHQLSNRMAAIEARLEDDQRAEISAEYLTQISAEFEAVAIELRAFVGE